MKIFIFTFFLFGCFTGSAQITVTVNWLKQKPGVHSDTIYYNIAEKLKWSDFKGKIGEPDYATAVTSSGFGYQAEAKYSNERVNIVIEVYCFFNKQNSWVKKHKASDYALNHEQKHFDITYIATHLFVKKLKEAVFTRPEYDSQLEKIYTDSNQLLQQMQQQYDKETGNGLFKQNQAEWDEKINIQLMEATKQ